MKNTPEKKNSYVFPGILLIAGMLLLAVSCKQSSQERVDQEVMVDVPGSQLYVRVRGNAAKPLIINLHGGPGGYSGIDIHLMGPSLEDKFLVGYLDQRGCGKSPECSDTSFLTVEQYIEDLDHVVERLMEMYNKETVQLMGTSWGGMYGFLYLLTHQDKVGSYACIDGKVNSIYQNHSLIEYELRRSREIMDTTESESRRKEMKFIIRELNRIKSSDFGNFHADVNWMKHVVPAQLGFNAYFVDTAKVISFDDVINDSSLLQLMRYTPEEYAEIGTKAEIVNTAFRNTPSYNNINIEDDLKRITTPTVVIQGEQDFVVGQGHAQLIYNALDNLSEGEKSLHIIPGVGHCPAIESPAQLSAILVDFFSTQATQ